MKRVAEQTVKITKNTVLQTNNVVKPAIPPKRDYATLSSGYFDKSSVPNTKTHPQVLQKDVYGNIITDNKRAGLTHSANLNPQHEANLPKVMEKYSIGLDPAKKKEQYCYHFDRNYTSEELAKYKEDPLLTKYLNEDASRLAKINWKFAYLRGMEHQKHMEKVVLESDKVFAELEEKIKNKK